MKKEDSKYSGKNVAIQKKKEEDIELFVINKR